MRSLLLSSLLIYKGDLLLQRSWAVVDKQTSFSHYIDDRVNNGCLVLDQLSLLPFTIRLEHTK